MAKADKAGKERTEQHSIECVCITGYDAAYHQRVWRGAVQQLCVRVIDQEATEHDRTPCNVPSHVQQRIPAHCPMQVHNALWTCVVSV